mgnify:FL=1
MTLNELETRIARLRSAYPWNGTTIEQENATNEIKRLKALALPLREKEIGSRVDNSAMSASRGY